MLNALENSLEKQQLQERYSTSLAYEFSFKSNYFSIIIEAVIRVSFVTEQPVALPRTEGPTAGVDLVLTDLATYVDSSGDRYKIKPLKAYRSRERKLARAQRSLARKKKGSKNQEKARLRVAKTHSKIARTRLDSNRKLALKLTGENQALGLETLAVKNLVKNRRLAKNISDASWSQLASLIESTGQREGCRVVRAVIGEGL